MTMNELEAGVHRIMVTVLACTKAHFQDELGIVIASTTTSLSGEINALALRKLTAIVSLGGPVNILAAFSFDQLLADHLMEVETTGLTLTPDERPQFLLDTVAETINVVLGHATTELAEVGNAVVLSAPVVLEDGGKLRRPKGAIFISVSHETAHGVLDVDLIAPRHLFGDNLKLTTS
jgi:CheY-specific phosphatase CheX